MKFGFFLFDLYALQSQMTAHFDFILLSTAVIMAAVSSWQYSLSVQANTLLTECFSLILIMALLFDLMFSFLCL